MFRNIFIIVSFSVLLSQAPDWDCDGDNLFDNLNAYESSGSVTLAVIINGSNAGSEGDMLGAFIGDELRGVAIPQIVWGGTYMFFTLIYSNQPW